MWGELAQHQVSRYVSAELCLVKSYNTLHDVCIYLYLLCTCTFTCQPHLTCMYIYVHKYITSTCTYHAKSYEMTTQSSADIFSGRPACYNKKLKNNLILRRLACHKVSQPSHHVSCCCAFRQWFVVFCQVAKTRRTWSLTCMP